MQVVDSEGYLKVKLVGGPVGPFVPYTGATGNVDLGEYDLKAGQFTLDTSPTGTAVVGTTRWNNTIGSSETTLKGGSVILKNGFDLVARVVNKVTPNATLTKANYTAVRVSGAQGQRLAVAYAQANSDANSADTIGLVIETIATNQEGFIMTVGQIEGVNTTGSLQGETWADGDVLYLSPTTPGALTNIKPTGLTGHIVVMGYVEYAHVNNGKIYVKIMNGWELDELHNVYINPATLANNNILQYDSADQLWKNQVLSTGITVGTTPIASGTIGRVLFQGTGNVLQQSSSLAYDDTAKLFSVSANQNATTKITISNTTSGTASTSELGLTSDSSAGYFNVGKLSTTISTYKIFAPKDGVFYNAIGGDISILNDAANGKIKFSAGQSATAQVTIASTGNVLINTTTDAGFRLDVNGTARVQGNTTFGTIATGTGMFWDNTNNRLGIGTGSPSYILHVRRDTLLATELCIENLSTGVNSSSNFRFITNAGFTSIGMNGSNDTGIGSNRIYMYSGTGASGIALRASQSTQDIRMYTGGDTASNLRMAIFSTGNIGINTTTDAGFRLDVNGTARVKGLGNSSATSSLVCDNSDGVRYLDIKNDGNIFVKTTRSLKHEVSNGVFYFDLGNIIVRNGDSTSASTMSIGKASTADASSILDLVSTTRGFLPPRMTTTQRNAIASPAAGLIVYDTTLNLPHFFNGTIWVSL
jgi:nitrogen fixation protein